MNCFTVTAHIHIQFHLVLCNSHVVVVVVVMLCYILYTLKWDSLNGKFNGFRSLEDLPLKLSSLSWIKHFQFQLNFLILILIRPFNSQRILFSLKIRISKSS